MSLIKKVKKSTALNPVARAIAKENLKRAVTTQRIAIFLLNNGEDCRGSIVALSLPVYAIHLSFERLGETDTPDARKLKSGCKVLVELAERNFIWKKAYAMTMDNALEICERRWAGIPPSILNTAINDLESSDA